MTIMSKIGDHQQVSKKEQELVAQGYVEVDYSNVLMAVEPGCYSKHEDDDNTSNENIRYVIHWYPHT